MELAQVKEVQRFSVRDTKSILLIKFLTYLNLVGTSPNQGMSTRPCLQARMGNLTQPALDTLITYIKTCTNMQHHILELTLCGIFGHLGTIVQIGFIISKMHSHIYEAYHKHFHHCLVQTHP